MAETQSPLESQTMLLAVIGSISSLAVMFGYVPLTAEQMGAIATTLCMLFAFLRTVSKGEKISIKKVTE